eukprot:jgi/Psemu1/193891/e_gw1.149.64.1
MVSDIPTCEDGDYFGLVLVINWPPSPLEDVDHHYQKFLGAVRSCFESSDVSSVANEVPAAYCQPIFALHVTLATFARIHKVLDHSTAGTDRRECEKKRATELVRAASKLPEWPKDPIRLVVDSAQIGSRAGILLWRDLSGGVEAIRSCLRKAAAAEAVLSGSTAAPLHPETYPTIPGIIHSTILRFSSVPKTPGTRVQEKFRSEVLAKIGKDFFPTNCDEEDTNNFVIVANSVKLACESTPYMHFEADEDHILWSCELTQTD